MNNIYEVGTWLSGPINQGILISEVSFKRRSIVLTKNVRVVFKTDSRGNLTWQIPAKILLFRQGSIIYPQVTVR